MKTSITLLICFSSLLSHAQRTSWPMINGDAMRTSNAEIDISFPLEVSATWDVGFKQEDGMIVTDDHIFLSNVADSNILYAIDVHTGDSLWQFGIPGTGGSVNYIPAAWEHLVLANGQGSDGTYALHAETGEVQWFKPTNSGYTRCPIITDGLAIIPGGAEMLCVDMANGEDQWSIPGSYPQQSPVADESSVYFGMGGEVYSVSKWTGEVNWKVEIPNGSFSTFSLDAERLYVSNQNSSIRALDKSNGDLIWTVELDLEEHFTDYPSCLAQAGEYLLAKFFVIESNRNHYLVLNRETGVEVNRFEGGRMYYGSFTVINNQVVDFADGNLLFSTIPEGDTAYVISIPDPDVTAQVIAAGDKIYIGANGPSIHVLQSKTTSTKTPSTIKIAEIYPNPASDFLQVIIDPAHSTQVDFTITSSDGKTIGTTGILLAENKTIPISDLSPGVYVLSLHSSDWVESHTFIKMH